MTPLPRDGARGEAPSDRGLLSGLHPRPVSAFERLATGDHIASSARASSESPHATSSR
jgi:hypothetical protein